jgi:hypothetical protein
MDITHISIRILGENLGKEQVMSQLPHPRGPFRGLHGASRPPLNLPITSSVMHQYSTIYMKHEF